MAQILVIDDNADLLQMMRLILQERGPHEVTLTADGADGLSRALSSPPDLAIIDVMMPGITGYDVVRRMREQPKTADIPILILTARGQMIDRQTALQAGADDHMAKPVVPQALLDKVEELLAARGKAAPVSGGGKVVSLMSLRGGVGVTTLAVNMALSGVRHPADRRTAQKVCLVDLCPASGQATLHLRVKAKQTWAVLPEIGTHPSPEALAALLTSHPSGLCLLAAPFEPTFTGVLTPSLVGGMLAGLRGLFDLIVIDAPPLIDVVAAAALDGADSIVLVLTPEVGAIQATVATLQVMDDLQDRVAVVLNQVSPQVGVPVAAVKKALRHPLAVKIPYDPAQMAALPQGKPLAWAKPTSPLAMAARRMLAVVSS